MINEKKIAVTTKIVIIVLFVLFGCTKKDQNVNNEYVLNTRTKKIHIMSCDAVGKMSEKNKKIVSETLVNLFKQKYVICKKCKAGIKKNIISQGIDKMLYSNLYIEKDIDLPSVDEYLFSIDEMCKWYVEHIPTYASRIQEENLKEYNGNINNYIVYELNNKEYNVISTKSEAISLDSLSQDSNIVSAKENAIVNYKNNYNSIKFKKNIAYYPCDLLEKSKDYNMPGDDCVRLFFAILNKMYSAYTEEYKILSKSTYSKTNSNKMALNIRDIPYALFNLGFEIYDKNEIVIDINNDKIPDGYISKIDDSFKLKKGDILVRKGHVHIYLGDGKLINAANFGWGRVYRNFPQYYNICVIKKDGLNMIELENSKKEKEFYFRVYRYIGKSIEGD